MIPVEANRDQVVVHSQISSFRKQWMDAPPDDGINVPKWKCHRPFKPKGASILLLRRLSRAIDFSLRSQVQLCDGQKRSGKM
jgi:hypothetical protein